MPVRVEVVEIDGNSFEVYRGASESQAIDVVLSIINKGQCYLINTTGPDGAAVFLLMAQA